MLFHFGLIMRLVMSFIAMFVLDFHLLLMFLLLLHLMLVFLLIAGAVVIAVLGAGSGMVIRLFGQLDFIGNIGCMVVMGIHGLHGYIIQLHRMDRHHG